MTAAPLVLKLGGRAFDAEGSLAGLARELADAGPAVVVHGGGAEINAWCSRLGLAPRFARGLRVTDPATIEVVAAVLAGLANKRLVAAFRDHGLDAVGLSAADGLATTVPHPQAAALGEVGAVAAIHRAPLDALLARGALPVLASLGASSGRLLNVNADDFAAALAAAFATPHLVLVSDAPGVVLGGQVTPRLDRAALDAALVHPEVVGGMAAKLAAAAAALDGGAARVTIAAWQGPGTLRRLVAGTAAGTTIEPLPLAEARRV